ncbi:DUF2513 domain-containing protein [Sedimentimonas flavescens]|uniref:DUF2513 domain-containing protein n=1 Tax=Sedimentimonas flavescens TaxID=2851012 RepID=UPI0021A7546D|nr:DUF2513 domain-containing protein [Sedimentimonas flavescens]MCT2540566.1 DUF2513 domain-containing protein [Sedimentimonas flavescens]
MNRDLERIRSILLECEASSEERFEPSSARFSDFDRYQIKLMAQAGLLMFPTVKVRPDAGHLERGLARWLEQPFSITWAGHDYLDAVRDQGVWDKTKSAVAETGGSASLEIVKALALGFLKKKISQHTGIEL